MNMEWVAGFEVHRTVCVKGCNAVYIVNTRCTGGRHRLQMQNPSVLGAALFTVCILLVSLFTYPSTLKMEAVPSSGTQDLLRNAPRYNSEEHTRHGNRLNGPVLIRKGFVLAFINGIVTTYHT
jgi:hypothetical protein